MRGSGLRRVIGLAVGIVGVVALAALSRVPWQPDSAVERAPLAAGAEVGLGERAIIRLSWRAPGELVSECRRLTQAEIESLPIHMRREEVCEGRILPYRLRVELDGRLVVNDLVRAAGAREDRPLYVYQELVVAPGAYQLEVEWEQERSGAAAGADDRSAEREGTTPLGRVPVATHDEERRRLGLSTGLHLDSGDIALITYDPDARVLRAHGAGVRVAAGEAQHPGG